MCESVCVFVWVGVCVCLCVSATISAQSHWDLAAVLIKFFWKGRPKLSDGETGVMVVGFWIHVYDTFCLKCFLFGLTAPPLLPLCGGGRLSFWFLLWSLDYSWIIWASAFCFWCLWRWVIFQNSCLSSCWSALLPVSCFPLSLFLHLYQKADEWVSGLNIGDREARSGQEAECAEWLAAEGQSEGWWMKRLKHEIMVMDSWLAGWRGVTSVIRMNHRCLFRNTNMCSINISLSNRQHS